MRHTYSRLAYAHWDSRGDPTRYLVSDSVMVPLLDGLLEQLPDIDRDVLGVKRDMAVQGCRMTPEACLDLARNTWEHLGGVSARVRLDELLGEKPIRPFEENHPYFGKSGGACDESGIRFYFDGSLSDAIYLAHETGHLVGDHTGFSPKNVAEIQAYFLQEAAYEKMARMRPEMSEALRLHRFAEYTSLGNHLRYADRAVQKERPDSKDEDRDVFNAHRHPTACVLASAMYQRFQGMTAASKLAALDVLFNSGPDVSMTDILAAFGMNDPEAIKKAGQSFCGMLASEARHFGVLKECARPQAAAHHPVSRL